MERDPFTVLGVQHGAEKAVVTAAYKALAKQYHPDLNPGDAQAAERMKEINDAYTAIRAGNYHEEEYYHPEWKAAQTASQGTAGPSGTAGTQTGTQPPGAGRTGYEYAGEPEGETVEQMLRRRMHGDRTKRQWYYNDKPMSFGKAVLHYAWDRWLKIALLYVIVPVLVLLFLYKALTGQNFGKQAKQEKQKVDRSLSHAEQRITLPQAPDTLMVQGEAYQMILPLTK